MQQLLQQTSKRSPPPEKKTKRFEIYETKHIPTNNRLTYNTPLNYLRWLKNLMGNY